MNIYVGNLPHRTTAAELQALFEPFGAVASAVIIFDKVTRNSRGFGFVEMNDESEANTAIENLNNSEYEGRTLKINEARPREDGPRPQRSFGNDRPRGGFNGGGGGYDRGGRGGGGFDRDRRGGGGFDRDRRGGGGYDRGGRDY